MTPLAQLAGLHGIESSYVDAFGDRHRVSFDTLRALLRSMNVAADSDHQVVEALREAKRSLVADIMDPVYILRHGYPATLSLRLPGRCGHGRLEWEVVDDGGVAHQGVVRTEDLPARAAADLGESSQGAVSWQIPIPLPLGEYRLNYRFVGDRAFIDGSASLFVTPARCFALENLGQDRLWGITAQLYAQWSASSWGIGDFEDLRCLAAAMAPLGAAAIGLNPLHALFPADPTHISPYSPSSRAFLNISYINVEAVPDLADCEAARSRLNERDLQQQLHDVRKQRTIDYAAVQRLKMPILTALFDSFCRLHLSQDSEPAQAFRAFVDQMAEPLRLQALFEALHEHGLEQGWSWRDWPSGFQDAESPDVETFADQHHERVLFFQYLQWIADQQLGEAQRAATVGGMPIGLYRDLAIGVHPGGAAAWANPGARLVGAHIGAPPDEFNPNGQDWGLAPFSPAALRLQGYAPFVEDLRQNMRHAGALRIDHVMGLQRLFLIPEGASPREGAYVRYPFNDLVRLAALQSRKQRCLVIGEDLGTVPAGFRQAMARASIMSCRLLYFERTKRSGLKSPKRYPKNALVAASTHDLPTLAGFWRGRDLEWRDRLDLYPSAEARCVAHRSRQADRQRLTAALRRAGLWIEQADNSKSLKDLVLAVHQFLAGSPSQLLMVQLEDVVGEIEQANFPGTTSQHPNWQRRLAVSLEDLAVTPRLIQLARILNAEGRAVRRTAQASSS